MARVHAFQTNMHQALGRVTVLCRIIPDTAHDFSIPGLTFVVLLLRTGMEGVVLFNLQTLTTLTLYFPITIVRSRRLRRCTLKRRKV